MTDEKALWTRARAYVATYVKRNKIRRKGCAECGAEAIAVIGDPLRPIETVQWLCREHKVQRRRNTAQGQLFADGWARLEREMPQLTTAERDAIVRRAKTGIPFFHEEAMLYRQRLLRFFLAYVDGADT